MHKNHFSISGATKLSHLEENLRSADIAFNADEVKELVSALVATGSRQPLRRLTGIKDSKVKPKGAAK